MSIYAAKSTFQMPGKDVYCSSGKGGVIMSVEENMELLQQENERLKRENEMMKKVVIQMRGTLNRMIGHYIIASGRKE